MSVSFLLQVTRIIHKKSYDEDDLQMIYDYLKNMDAEILNDYFNTCTVLSYANDLELFSEILDRMISILEEKEEYEKCQDLQLKKLECKSIMLQKP